MWVFDPPGMTIYRVTPYTLVIHFEEMCATMLIPKCIFEVTFKYSHSLHHIHNDYPLAPKQLVIEEELLNIPIIVFPNSSEKKHQVNSPSV